MFRTGSMRRSIVRMTWLIGVAVGGATQAFAQIRSSTLVPSSTYSQYPIQFQYHENWFAATGDILPVVTEFGEKYRQGVQLNLYEASKSEAIAQLQTKATQSRSMECADYKGTAILDGPGGALMKTRLERRSALPFPVLSTQHRRVFDDSFTREGKAREEAILLEDRNTIRVAEKLYAMPRRPLPPLLAGALSQPNLDAMRVRFREQQQMHAAKRFQDVLQNQEQQSQRIDALRRDMATRDNAARESQYQVRHRQLETARFDLHAREYQDRQIHEQAHQIHERQSIAAEVASHAQKSHREQGRQVPERQGMDPSRPSSPKEPARPRDITRASRRPE